MAKAGCLQTSEHHVQRRALLRNEQDRLSPSHDLGDHVGDRLALTRSRRTADDAVLLAQRRGDGLLLRGIGVEDQELLLGWNAIKRLRIDASSIAAGTI